MRAKTRSASLFVLGAILVASCAPDASNATPIAVELADDSIALSPNQLVEGRVVFEAQSLSDGLVHEFEVFSGGVDGGVLSVSNAVADVSGLRLLDEVEDIVPGANASLTMDLEAGTYLIICNLPEHYAAGMWAYLTVTAST